MCVMCISALSVLFPKISGKRDIYFPLLAWLVYLVLKVSIDRKMNLFLVGAVLGLLHVSRHITLVIVPFVFLYLYLVEFKGLKGERVKALSIVLLGYLMIYLPWVLNGLANGFSMGQILGLVLESYHLDVFTRTFGGLIKWGMIYLCYFILMIAPMVLILSYGNIVKYKSDNKEYFKRFLIFVSGSFVFIFIAMVRHSWNMDYNYPIPLRIIGRYYIYFNLFCLIITYVILQRIDMQKIDRFFNKRYIVSMLLIVFSYFFIFTEWFIRNNFIRGLYPPNWVHGISYVYIQYMIWIILIYMTIFNILLLRRSRHVIIVFTMLIIVFFSLSIQFSQQKYNLRYQPLIHGGDLVEFLDMNGEKYPDVYFSDSIGNKWDRRQNYFLYYFWTNKTYFDTQFQDFSSVDNYNRSSGYLLTEEKILFEEEFVYMQGESEFYLYPLPIK